MFPGNVASWRLAAGSCSANPCGVLHLGTCICHSTAPPKRCSTRCTCLPSNPAPQAVANHLFGLAARRLRMRMVQASQAGLLRYPAMISPEVLGLVCNTILYGVDNGFQMLAEQQQLETLPSEWRCGA